MKQQELVKDFFKDYLLQGNHERTVRVAVYNLARFFEYLSLHDLEYYELKWKDAQDYQGWLLKRTGKNGRQYSKGTIKNHIKACVAFYDYLYKKGTVLINPFKNIKAIRQSKQLPKDIPKENQMHSLLTGLQDFHLRETVKACKTGYRVHVITELMYATGMRANEVADLTEDDIDLDRGIVYVKQGKGRDKRQAILNSYAKDVLNIYINEMKPLVMSRKNKGRKLFGTGTASLIRLVNIELARKTKELGLQRMTSHGFRHALGSHLLKAGCDIRFIQDILGHKRLGSTEIYIRVDKEDLKNILDACHPRKLQAREE